MLDLPIISNFFARQVLFNFFQISAGGIKPGLDFSDVLLDIVKSFIVCGSGSDRYPDDFVLDDAIIFLMLFHYREHKRL